MLFITNAYYYLIINYTFMNFQKVYVEKKQKQGIEKQRQEAKKG